MDTNRGGDIVSDTGKWPEKKTEICFSECWVHQFVQPNSQKSPKFHPEAYKLLSYTMWSETSIYIDQADLRPNVKNVTTFIRWIKNSPVNCQCGRLSWLMLAFERTLKSISYRIVSVHQSAYTLKFCDLLQLKHVLNTELKITTKQEITIVYRERSIGYKRLQIAVVGMSEVEKVK